MRVFLFLLAACLTLPSYAASIDGYVPGQPKSFEFRLPPVSNLGSYNVELLLTSPTGVAGTDFYFDASATAPAASNYVFSSAENFFASVNVLPGNTHSLTLSDFSLTGTNVVAGMNDAVASIVYRTSPSFNGVLSMSLGEDTFQLDTPALNPTPVGGYSAALAAVAADVSVEVSPVPEPGALAICGIAMLSVGFTRRWSRAR